MPLGSWLKAATGTWLPIFVVAIVFDVTAAVLALFVLKPLSTRALSVGTAALRGPISRTISNAS